MGMSSRRKWERRTREFFKAFAEGTWNGGEKYRSRFRNATKILFCADQIVKAEAKK